MDVSALARSYVSASSLFRASRPASITRPLSGLRKISTCNPLKQSPSSTSPAYLPHHQQKRLAFLKSGFNSSAAQNPVLASLATDKSSERNPLPFGAPGSSDSGLRTTIYFTIVDRVGALDEVLVALKDLSISLKRIESRPSRSKHCYDFFIDFDAATEADVRAVMDELKNTASVVNVVSVGASDADTSAALVSVPWFPRKISDLDAYATKDHAFGAQLSSDHPGFTDAAYRARRAEITRLATQYRHGEPLPNIEYTDQEIATWGAVYEKLMGLHRTHACEELQYVYPLLVQNCGYSPSSIPQLASVSRFLKDCTGWTLRPVTGLLTSRDFLNALAFRVFHSTQYIRHHSRPFYTPEPDVCHEMLGHVPLYADPDFAEFSQEIGLASLGATDEDCAKLTSIYWFTVEFGLCRQKGEIKAYGAGLLSSFGELEYCLTEKPKKVPFDPHKAAVTPYPITEYQPHYFVAESFRDMKDKVREFAATLKRPFAVRYNALTQRIEVLDNKEDMVRFATGIRGDLSRLISALDKLAEL
ncbi:Biopterin-dependent aromatic amino acid hydroxylase-domain-containing protein [Cladochytrium replicatum]|nr:Biopterin-dependent aromatic amino acid hydroxylase-domain-containing protein [Cladochytrium replicatum]